MKLTNSIIVATSFLLSFSCAEDPVIIDVQTKQQSHKIGKEGSVEGLKSSVLMDDGFDESQIKDIATTAFRFPSINASDCSSVQPSLCEWGKAAHDVVLLEVTDVSFVRAPTVDSVTGDLIQTCNAALFPALKIEGIIGDSVNGNSGAISVEIGYDQYNRWNIWPYLNGLRKLTWPLNDFKIGHGSRIGMSLHKNVATGTHSVLGDPFFQVDKENKIEFSDFPEKCRTLEPQNVSGKTFRELREQLRNCPESEGISDRIRKKENLWNDRKFADLGLCLSR